MGYKKPSELTAYSFAQEFINKYYKEDDVSDKSLTRYRRLKTAAFWGAYFGMKDVLDNPEKYGLCKMDTVYHRTFPLNNQIIKRVDEGDYFRADGECECPICKMPYKRHRVLEGYEWLNILCNGWLVKL